MGSTENLRNIKSRKTKQKLPRSVKEMSKEALQLALIKKKECNAKALQIVERLLENNITEDWFLDSLKFISVCHLEDIIEERAITKNCGYPLCHNVLKNVPSQQYRISTKLNKVYDITERKHFCSNDCYKASNYVKDQMLTSPLWMRDKEEIPKFKLIPLRSVSGGAGEEVDIGQSAALRKELKELQEQERNSEFTSVSQFTIDSLSQLSKNVDRKEKKERKEKSESRKKMQNKESEVVKQENISLETQAVTQHINHNEGSDNEDSTTINDRNEKEELNEIILMTEKLSLTEENEKVSRAEHESISITSSENLDVKTPHLVEDIPKSCTAKASKNNTKQEDCTATESTYSSSEKISEKNPQTEAIVKTDTKVKGNKEKTKVKKTKSHKQESATVMPNIPPSTSSVIHIEKCLYEWFTIESMCFLFGEEKVKQMVSEKGECIKEYYKAVNNCTWDPRLQEQYASICRRLNIMELEDSQYDSQVTKSENHQKPLPDYSAVKEEGRKMELKVKAYFKGQVAYEDPGSAETQTVKQEESVPVLPLVDLHAQNALRRRIVLDRLNRVLPDLLRTFGLTSRDIGSDVRKLVTSFSLGAHNIMFKPPEWSLIGLIIIKMISIKDIRLKLLLESEQVTKYTTLMLIAFQQDGGYLERLMAWLTDIDNLLQKQ